jgi:hypothetical protein
MYRKYVAPLSEGRVLKLIKLYAKNTFQLNGVFDDFEYCLGQLYKAGIVQIKKRFEKGHFVMLISLTEAGMALLNQSQMSMEPAL